MNGSLYEFGAFNADPHPGNYLFHDDGGVTFLDFGCVKRFSLEQIVAMRRISKAVFDEFAASTLERNFDAFGAWGDVVRGMGIGPESKDWHSLTRIQVGLYSVLGALRTTCDWRAVHHELMNGGPPQTDLGRQHQTWNANRALS